MVRVQMSKKTPATVLSVMIQRTGAVSDGAFNAVSIWDENNNVKLGGAMINTNHQANVPVSITLNQGITRTIKIDGDMALDLSAYAGQSGSLSLVSLSTTD